jgi:heme exporter protein B
VTAFLAQVGRELRLALRQSADLAMVVLFFALVAALFPFAIGPEPNLLMRLAPGVIWVSALLSVLLSLERLFLADYEDGTLELLVIGPQPLELVVLAKALAHWLTAALPLVAAAPVVSVLYNLSAEAVGWLMLALALGTPSLSLVGAVGAALALGARRGGVLIPIIVLPLYVPTLIFGVMASEAALAGLSAKPYLLFLGAILLLMLFVAPLAAAAGLRHSME